MVVKCQAWVIITSLPIESYEMKMHYDFKQCQRRSQRWNSTMFGIRHITFISHIINIQYAYGNGLLGVACFHIAYAYRFKISTPFNLPAHHTNPPRISTFCWFNLKLWILSNFLVEFICDKHVNVFSFGLDNVFSLHKYRNYSMATQKGLDLVYSKIHV